MKPCLKLKMLEGLADSLPLCCGTALTPILYRVFNVCSRSEAGVLMLHWQNEQHVALLEFLHNQLRPEVYAWVRSHLRFDGVPPAVLKNIGVLP